MSQEALPCVVDVVAIEDYVSGNATHADKNPKYARKTLKFACNFWEKDGEYADEYARQKNPLLNQIFWNVFAETHSKQSRDTLSVFQT